MTFDKNIEISEQDIEDIIRGLTNVRHAIIETLETLPDKKYTDEINSLFRTIHSFKAFIFSFEFASEIIDIIEKSEDIMSFLRNNDCVIGEDVRNWFDLMAQQIDTWINEFTMIFDDFINGNDFIKPPSPHANALDNPPQVKVYGYNITKIETHRILILLNDTNKIAMLEKILDSNFSIINTSDSVEKISNIIKTSPEKKILISDIKMKDGTLIDLINQKILVNTELVLLSKMEPASIENAKKILKTDCVFNIETIDLRELKKIVTNIALPNNDMVYIPFVSTKISLTELTKSIKSMPEIVEKIKEACYDDNIHFSKLSEIIQQDMVVTGKILKQINSAYYGVRNHVSSVERALTLMGKQNLYAITIQGMSEEMMCDTDLSMYGIAYDDIFEINKLRTKFLKSICNELRIGQNEFETLSTVSLLSAMGTVMAAKALAYNLQHEKFSTLRKTDSLYKVEKKLLDYTSYQIASKIFSKWRLPPHFIRISDNMPCLQLNKNRGVDEYHAFIMTLVHEIIRMDDIYRIDASVLEMAKMSDISPATITDAFYKAFGKEKPLSGTFTDLMVFENLENNNDV